MRKIFIYSLAISAVLQLVLTRHRAGNAFEEGAAEAMWLRYPLNVVLNAALWTAAAAALSGGARAIRRAL